MCSRRWVFRASVLMMALILATTCFAIGNDHEKGISHLQTKPLTNGLLEANSNRQVHPFSTEPVASSFTTEKFEKVGETDFLEIYLNREDGALRILNKETGYLWGALPLDEADGLNTTWRCYGNSLVSIECFNEEGVESRVSIGKNGSVTYDFFEDSFLCSVEFAEYGISFQVKVSWSENKLSMSLVEGTLAEGENGSPYTLKSMTFMPYLGSAYSDSIDGYIFIPDGSGALIRFRQPANYGSTYASRIYGKDYGIATLASTADNSARPEAQVLMPVYGIVHGAYQNAFLAVVNGGTEYATILAAPAQANNPYNWSAARFEFREKYIKSINRKEGAGASVPQEVPNVVTPDISFYFVGGGQANYDGMAVMYREMLISQGVLTPLELTNPAVPLQIEILGAGKKKEFLWNTTSVFTTVDQAEEIVDRLAMAGVGNQNIVLRSYTPNNECGKPSLPKIGSVSDMNRLNQKIGDLGGAMYFYTDPVTANEDQINFRTEAAHNLSKMEVKWIEPLSSSLYPYTYLFHLTNAQKHLFAAVEQAEDGALALAQVTNKLYGDYTTGKEITRKDGLALVQAMVDSATNGKKIPMYQPNQYLWKFTDKIFDMPATNTQIIYESDSVPFLQIVLSGCVEMYGSSINRSSVSGERLLRQVEYGMAPAFTVTGCDSSELYNTAQEMNFSTSFADWESTILDTYAYVSDGLSDVWGHSITSHKCLENGLIEVGYDNDVCIYLNYTDTPLDINEVRVDSGRFVVVRRG